MPLADVTGPDVRGVRAWLRKLRRKPPAPPPPPHGGGGVTALEVRRYELINPGSSSYREEYVSPACMGTHSYWDFTNRGGWPGGWGTIPASQGRRICAVIEFMLEASEKPGRIWDCHSEVADTGILDGAGGAGVSCCAIDVDSGVDAATGQAYGDLVIVFEAQQQDHGLQSHYTIKAGTLALNVIHKVLVQVDLGRRGSGTPGACVAYYAQGTDPFPASPVVNVSNISTVWGGQNVIHPFQGPYRTPSGSGAGVKVKIAANRYGKTIADALAASPSYVSAVAGAGPNDRSTVVGSWDTANDLGEGAPAPPPGPGQGQFGASSAGGSNALPGIGFKFGSRFTLNADADVTTFQFYAQGGGTAPQTFTPAIYRCDGSDNPTSRAILCPPVTVGASDAAGWTTSTLPAKQRLTPGRYALVLLSGATDQGAQIFYAAGAATDGIYNADGGGSPSDPFGAFSTEARLWSFRVNYDAPSLTPPPAVAAYVSANPDSFQATAPAATGAAGDWNHPVSVGHQVREDLRQLRDWIRGR